MPVLVMIRGRELRASKVEMCEACPLPDTDRPRIPRAAKIQCGILLLVAAVVIPVAVFGSGGRAARGHDPVPTAPERVFLGDMVRQTAEAHRLVAEAAGSPGVAALARQIESEDRSVLRDVGGPLARLRKTEPASNRLTPRQALRRHIDEDRIIAQVELATGTNAAAKNAAARLLDASARLR